MGRHHEGSRRSDCGRHHWRQATQTDKPRRGTGNGLAMKVAPVKIYMGLTNPAWLQPQWSADIDKLAQLATMTHANSMAITSGFAQAYGVLPASARSRKPST